MPYWDRRAETVIILPDQGSFAEIEEKLTGVWVETRLAELYSVNSNYFYLIMPKFRLEPPVVSLKPALSAMQMTDAFSDRADFSGIGGKGALKIHDIAQKVYIDVDEQGTEAAAFTWAVFSTINGPLGVIEMKVDRPFIFFIRDTRTGTILFLGRVTALKAAALILSHISYGDAVQRHALSKAGPISNIQNKTEEK